MARSAIRERRGRIASAADDFPEYREPLELHEGILEILQGIDETPTKGARSKMGDEEAIALAEAAASSKRSIGSLLEPSIFDVDIWLIASEGITRHLVRSGAWESLGALLDALEGGEIDSGGAVAAFLGEDATWFRRLGGRLGVEPSLLILVFGSPLQPFFEEVARRVEDRFIETWWEAECPVCGRIPSVAWMRGGKRYLSCTFCGAEHLVDLFLCPGCGNADPYTLAFASPEGHPEYEVSYCERCRRYLKVLYADRMVRMIPPGLEDLLTQELDRLAAELGLERP